MITTTRANDILNGLFRGSNVYIGLSTTVPNTSGGNFTEPDSATGYKRYLLNSAYMNQASSKQISNNATLFLYESDDNAATVNVGYVGLFSAPSGGTPYFVGALKKNNGTASNPVWVDTTVPISAKNVPLFRAGSLLATLDK